jgi:hypothetical protein
MILATAIAMGLDRAGLDNTTVTYKDQMRLYMNIVAKRVAGRAKWWWLHKSTTFKTTFDMTVTGISGPFQAGEVITTAGGATGKVGSFYDPTNTPTTIPYYFHTATTTAFTSTVTGGTSGATATFSSTTETRTYQLPTDVLVPHSFWDETNNSPLTFRSLDVFDTFDPDRSETGNVSGITIEGLDDNRGRIVARFHPAHSTSNETIRMRYLAYIPDWTSDDDSSELDKWIPEMLQSCIVFGGAELYMQEKGDSEGAIENRAEYGAMMEAGLETNLRIWGNRQWRREGSGSVDEAFSFFPQEGSLTA